ncbi:MAG TPA: YdeI/OmpD-associated family protein [Aggregatilineaceae bacterium]|nr:YdeI/OmpD-associated family protein [Aggregatilineaceae bacterium]
MPDYEHYYPQDRAEFRQWLAENHTTSPGIWLIFYKKHTGQPTIPYPDAVEEALCFGWIDSTAKTLDEDRTIQLFTPRKPKSIWAKSNKQRVEKLIAQGLMTEAGLAKIEIAKQNGSWTLYDSVDALIIPDDLQAALNANDTARANFEAFSNSAKKMILWWIISAKRPETRAKRIQETVAQAALNKRAHID